MPIISLLFSALLALHPSPIFECDGKILNATIRNNLNGDFSITNDLENIDKGAFIVLDWDEISLMLPISFKYGDITFTDKKWLWSYQEGEGNLRMDNPRFAQLLPGGQIVEHKCESIRHYT